MAKLNYGVWVAAVLTLASCATVEVPPPMPVPIPAPDPVLPIATPEADAPVASPPAPDPVRLVASHPVVPEPAPLAAPKVLVSPLDLDSWPFGWVIEVDSSLALGLDRRFWTDQKARWREALGAQTSAPRVVRVLELIQASGSPEEAARAAWLLFRAYTRSLLFDQARTWLDRAAEFRPTATTVLERVWDQVFRLHDVTGARALWVPGARWSDADQERKARLLRQKLFAGALSPRAVGADDFLSTQILDRDDLWAGTWNGAVVRWSLATGQLDLVLPAEVVSPVKLLVATGWFLYAFQDQSLMRYSKVTGEWRSFPYPSGWTGLRVQAAVADGEEGLWVAHLGQGLWRWDRGQWTLVDGGGGGPFLNTLASDGVDGLLVGTKDRGLWRWKAGSWSPVSVDGPGPVNVSVVQPSDDGRWLVGTWGEGTWILDHGTLSRWSEVPDYVTAAAWDGDQPLWGALDQGLVRGRGTDREVLGPREGVATGAISGLVTWQGRWIWGTTGQGWGWWSEHENPALFR